MTIKGTRNELEREIDEYIAAQSLDNEHLHKEYQLFDRSTDQEPPYILYTACGISEKAAFIFGVCNTRDNRGILIISRIFKPRSYLAAFIESVKELFPQTSMPFKRTIVSQFRRRFKSMVEQTFENSSIAADNLPDLKLLDVLEDASLMDRLLLRERST